MFIQTGSSGKYIKGERRIEDDFYITCNGRRVGSGQTIQDGKIYHIVLRLPGGKGGFGSMLRAIGAQIDKTNNREACRDLSGRRMRDVNNEKQMKEWLSKQSQREKEKEERRRERWERRKAMPNHKFDDPLYDQQRAQVFENLEDAVQKGLSKSQAASSTATSSEISRKRPAAATAAPSKKVKKSTEWLGIDVDNISDLDSDESDTELSGGATACPIDAANDKPHSDSWDDSNSASNHSSASYQVTRISDNLKVEDISNEEIHCGNKFIIPLESNIENEVGMDFRIKVEKGDNGVKSKIDNVETQSDAKDLPFRIKVENGENSVKSEMDNIETQNDAQALTFRIKVENGENSGVKSKMEDETQNHAEDPTVGIKIENCEDNVKSGINKIETQNDTKDLTNTGGNDAAKENPNTKAISEHSEPSDVKDSREANIERELGPVDIDQCNSADDLIAFGLDKLKEELMARQLKCGGTLQERAQRLFSVKGLTRDQIDPTLFAKPTKGKKKK
ncbi:hypothetical protein FSP39_020170 [Pinctada imbricata]|uniref:Replication stress response regulator SDE2 n=1 Tax=Pinctada imbricata TaxID=66713 RepID=A0AA88Y7N8_PINIB|nr:hypothetical protein FSP39_020170 [Pinctada imbricata]